MRAVSKKQFQNHEHTVMKPSSLALIAFLNLLLSSAAQASWTASSTPQQVRLVELYTSQGCSSCPPADSWLASMKSRDDLWQGIVPVAWHVTYWDYLGWHDPFASKHNDSRQQRMAVRAGASVYTPGVFVDRGEWRSWRRSSPGLPGTHSNTVGILSAVSENGHIRVQFDPAAHLKLKAPMLELVFLRTGLSTSVKAGENRGRKLIHEFVAGDLTKVPLQFQQGRWMADFSLQSEEDSKAVALWVLDREDRYLQATGSWLYSR